MPRIGYVDVDRLQAETTLEAAAAKCGVSLDIKGSGAEVRIDCPFGCAGDHCGRKEVAINTDNPQKIFQCHAYECKFRGNLLTLMHGWAAGNKPMGEKLKGPEFQRAKQILTGDITVSPGPAAPKKPQAEGKQDETVRPTNIALIDATEERVRELGTIDTKFETDVATMNPFAAAYVRKHPVLFSESMKKWRCGYLPMDGGGDKRGWSLRGSIVYPVLSENGKVLAWVGRDVQYEKKEQEYARMVPAERIGKDPPAKHRFPKGFHRSLELFGQHASRLQEPGYRKFIREHGLILVEGFNDVIGLDHHGVPALGIMSNRMTEAQGEKVQRFLNQLGINRVNLMFDNDPPGVEGAKETLWWFAERKVDVRLVWSPSIHGGEFAGKQPEGMTELEKVKLFG